MRNRLRDWRVWALLVTVQWPGLHTIAKYAPWPALATALVVVTAADLYAGLLHGHRPRALAGHRWPVPVAIAVVLAINLACYPRVDALKTAGRGSDQDDALIVTARRLVTAQQPVYTPTYLGNPPSPGPVWALVVAPLAASGAYALLTPTAFALLIWIVSRYARRAGVWLATIVPLSSPGFWELLVNGSDLFAIGVLFTSLVVVGHRWRPGWLGVVTGGLAAAAASSRVVFACVPAGVAAFMWRAGRPGALTVAAVTVATVVAEGMLWMSYPPGTTPMHIVTDTTQELGIAWVICAVIAFGGCAIFAASRAGDSLAAWLRGVWLMVSAPLLIVTVGALMTREWRVEDWYAASYLEVAVAPLVASIALDAASEGQPGPSS